MRPGLAKQASVWLRNAARDLAVDGRIGSWAAETGIRLGAAIQCIVAVISGERVSAIATTDRIVAITADDHVVAAQP